MPAGGPSIVPNGIPAGGTEFVGYGRALCGPEFIVNGIPGGGPSFVGYGPGGGLNGFMIPPSGGARVTILFGSVEAPVEICDRVRVPQSSPCSTGPSLVRSHGHGGECPRRRRGWA